MYFRQILQDDLGCASYLIADGGEAVVVDPKWEIEEYLAAAEEAGAVITRVLETHNHADHVSGRRRLVDVTGAEVLLPADPEAPERGGVRGGDVIGVGRLELHALPAAGHRPEHLAFAVYEGETPRRLLSGDSLLIGGVARPDLAVAADEGADALFDTLARLEALGDDVELWPAHVGGSLCGAGSVTKATSSTIGDERASNPLLAIGDRAEFVEEITAGSPTRPPRVERVVALNVTGAEAPAPLPYLAPGALAERLAAGACALDIRTPDVFDAGHLAGALNLAPAGKGLGNRAGWATRPEEPIVLLAPSLKTGARFAPRLYAAGIWNLAGIALADPAQWTGLDVRTAESLTPAEVVAGLRAGDLQLIDVRDPGEWRLGHVAGSRNLPLSELGDGRAITLAPGQRYAVACAAGARAALAASILRRAGHVQIARMSSGIADLGQLGLELVTGE